MNPKIQGWFDFADIYGQMVELAPPGAILIELGVWKGASLVALGKAALQSQKSLKVFGVDRWIHDEWDGYAPIMVADRENDQLPPYAQCVRNLKEAGLDFAVELLEEDSIDAASYFQNGTIFFVFMDDTHSPEHVEREIAAWLPKIQPGGWIGGHDYFQVIAGVRKHFPNARHVGNSWLVQV